MKEVKDHEGKVIGYDLTLEPAAVGAEVRNHLVDLQNIYGLFSAYLDEAAYNLALAKLLVEEVDTLATEIIEDSLSKMPIQRKSPKKYNKLNMRVQTKNGNEVTLLEAKRSVVDLKKIYDQADSKLKELDRAINTSRSLLAWDRMEYGNS